jgi:hypothetical protein
MSRSIHSRTARIGVTALAAAAVLATGGVAASPASSAPDPGCPAPFPIADLGAGDAVTGLTVTTGTTPGGFTGQVQGVLEDGIAPGVDMILADLHSPTIDKVGIWSGMSGSPVYAADGRLVGAVSYSLGLGPSTIAGITPAAEMAELGSASTTTGAARQVRVPSAVAHRMVGARVASAGEISQGLTQLRVPRTVSGLSSARMAKLARVLRLGGGTVATGTAGATSTEQIPIVAGGNLAASESYGTVTAAGVGTATTVCGNQLTGFGHPMDFTGSSTLSLHGARAVLVQDDPTLSGFKVANLGAPIGSVDQDRLAGLHATTGAIPATSTLHAAASDAGRSFTGTTHLSVPADVAELGFAHLIAVQDKAMDRLGKGRAYMRWTINGTRANGAPFSMSRTNRFADPYDLSAATAIALADDLSAIQDNPDEVVKVTSVDARTYVNDDYERYAISRVQALVHGHWVTGSTDDGLPLVAGKVARLRVLLTSREGAPRTVEVRVKVPTKVVGKVGILDVTGGNPTDDSEDFFFLGEDAFDFEETPAPSATSFPKLLDRLEHQQKNNEIVATLRFRRVPAPVARPRTGKVALDRVVSGERAYPVFGIR